MKKTIGFFTGARSDYGIMKNLIREIELEANLEYKLFISGIHLLESFGNTRDEIEADGFTPAKVINSFREDSEPGAAEFSTIISALCKELEADPPHLVFIIGDRIESYAAALACHFSRVPIIHSGGGTITKGAVDNIYRYNISNLATYHFATSKVNTQRLLQLPCVDSENVFFTGSFAVDAIKKFKSNPTSIKEIIPEIEPYNYCVVTFHSVTQQSEPIPAVLENIIRFVLDRGCQVLMTYPNNDAGYLDIVRVIERWRDHHGVFVRKNLGALGYYAALNECLFVVGNSSSGLIEAPYFNRKVINVGNRQEGRETDVGVYNVPSRPESVLDILRAGFDQGWGNVECNELFGSGDTLGKIKNILSQKILFNAQIY